MSIKYGVFIARMQPVHNAHLFLINKALEENDRVLIILGSENKSNTIRNPYNVELRKMMLKESLTKSQNDKLDIITLPDWSMETDEDSNNIWGRYLYYNIVSRIGQKNFSLYYSDDVSILDNWFEGTEVRKYINYRNFDRNNLFEGLSATKIRQAFVDGNVEYIKENCPKSVVNRFDYLSVAYRKTKENPDEDFSME